MGQDERAQAIQIGAVLIFAMLIVAFSGYQAVVVPQQNKHVEFDHNKEVHQELQDLRNAILSIRGGGTQHATSVTLGTRYPPRAIAVNPSPPAGTLRTVGTADGDVAIAIDNATASGEAGDVWDGSKRTFDSGSVVYTPLYNRYASAPATIYEQTVLYNQFADGALVLANQSFLDGRTIDLVALNGSYDRTESDAVTIDVRPVSTSADTTRVEAEAADSPVTIAFQSRLGPDRWATILSDQENVVDVSETAGNGTADLFGIRVELDPAVSYRLSLTKVGIGTRVSDEEPSFLTVERGQGASVAQGSSEDVVVAVRDGYNNPVPDVSVNASVSGTNNGSLDDTQVNTDEDGHATFRYTTTGSTDTGTHQINVTMDDAAVLSDPAFDGSSPTNATVDVTVN